MAKTKRPIGTNPAHTYQVFAFTYLSVTGILRHVPLQVYQAEHPDNLLLFFRERIKRFFNHILKRKEKIMTATLSEMDVHQAIGQVKHPAIDHSLVDLGIVKDVTIAA